MNVQDLSDGLLEYYVAKAINAPAIANELKLDCGNNLTTVNFNNDGRICFLSGPDVTFCYFHPLSDAWLILRLITMFKINIISEEAGVMAINIDHAIGKTIQEAVCRFLVKKYYKGELTDDPS